MIHNKITDYDFPKDLDDMSEDDLRLLAYQIRDFLIENVSKTGGHLAPNLGVVELTIALHKVFNFPEDKIVWDVGHQSYIHKILSGRADKFSSLRQYEGLSGFPKSSESASDIYNSGHSSSSISAAAGIAEARDIHGDNFNVIALIGDGAMTGGLAFEGLNNVGSRGTSLIVILNDNEMSISENTGSMSQHLGHLRSSKKYVDLKRSLRKKVLGIPAVGDGIYQGLDYLRDVMKAALIPDSIFEDLGFAYYGPVDGNNVHDVIGMLEFAKDTDKPILIHVVTKKGKGYKNAELKPEKFHGIGPFDPETGKEYCSTNGNSWSSIAGNSLLELAKKDDRVVAITAAMTDGTGLTEFANELPNRFFDVGIAEQHAVTLAAGMAIGGIRPYFYVYSSFLQRAYDQILIDVAMQKLPVVFMVDRAGCGGQDGETHHGLFDNSYLNSIPNMTILAPRDASTLRAMLDYSLVHEGGPISIRYPRGLAPTFGEECAANASQIDKNEDSDKSTECKLPKSTVMREGTDIEILAVGSMLPIALEAADILQSKGINAMITDAGIVKPIDEVKLTETAKAERPLITLEDNVIIGGFGERVSLFFSENKYKNSVKVLGWPDTFVAHGTVEELLTEYGLDAPGVVSAAEALLSKS